MRHTFICPDCDQPIYRLFNGHCFECAEASDEHEAARAARERSRAIMARFDRVIDEIKQSSF